MESILTSALHKYVTYLLTYLDTYQLTYSPGMHIEQAGLKCRQIALIYILITMKAAYCR